MNILYRANASRDNYVLDVLEALRKRKVIEKATVISQTIDDNDNFPQEHYHEIKSVVGYNCGYNSICDYDELPAISETLLTKMLPYKTTIFELMCRRFHMHILTFDEMEIRYIRHLRFWNYILETDNIGMCFFACVPHTAWEYTIYALAKCKNIPTLLIDEIWIHGLNSVMTDIFMVGNNAKNTFDKALKINLDDNCKKFYKSVVEKKLYSEEEKIINKNEYEDWFRRLFFVPLSKRQDTLLKMKKELEKGEDRFITQRTIWNCEDDIEYCIRQNEFEKKYVTPEYINKKVEIPPKYILFLLQYTPEASTLPRAGVFSSQISTIQLLAEAAKEKDMVLVVKEHWVQWKRNKKIYNELSMIKNVLLVNDEYDNGELMKNATMLASHTGTCIIEGMLTGIPVLAFANNVAMYAPGVYRVGTKEEICKAIDHACKIYKYDGKIAKAYYAAICKTSIRGYLDWDSNAYYSIEDCKSDIIELIDNYVNSGMPDDYYFENDF